MQIAPSGGQIVTNASSAIWWPKLDPILIALHVSQICNQFWWHHLVVKFWTYLSGTTYNWPNLEPMHVAFYSAGEITQVKESIPWVRCASGNVFLLGCWSMDNLLIITSSNKPEEKILIFVSFKLELDQWEDSSQSSRPIRGPRPRLHCIWLWASNWTMYTLCTANKSVHCATFGSQERTGCRRVQIGVACNAVLQMVQPDPIPPLPPSAHTGS